MVVSMEWDIASLFQGIGLISFIFAASAILHLMLPGRQFVGYACSDKKLSSALVYKLNGMLVAVVMLFALCLWAVMNHQYRHLRGNRSDIGYKSNLQEDVIHAIVLQLAHFYRLSAGCILGGSLWGLLGTYLAWRRGKFFCTQIARPSQHHQEPIRCRTKDDQLLKSAMENDSPSTPVATTNSRTTTTTNTTSSSSSSNNRVRSLDSWRSMYFGIGEFNPRILNDQVDIKMWLYLAGSIMLQFQVLTALGAHCYNYYYFHHCSTNEEYNNTDIAAPNEIVWNLYEYYNNHHADKMFASNAMILSTFLWTWFVGDYLCNEHVHLYTYDIFAERIGFKLVWGCLGLYPFWYPMGQHYMVLQYYYYDNHHPETETSFWNPQDLSLELSCFLLVLFWVGSLLTRGANTQKYIFKTQPDQLKVKLLGGIIVLQQRKLIVQLEDGKTEKHLLIGGFWLMARHINYLGEILQGVAMGLPPFLISRNFFAMGYAIFITIILVLRERDDDRLCRIRYGDKAWDEYTLLVPYRIVPVLY